MKKSYKILLLAILVCFLQAAKAQDTLHIEQLVKVNKGEELKIKAGTVVSFKPGARIWVEGALNINGTKEQPVVFISENKNDPGVGIIINGIDASANITVQNTSFIGLIQAISFEPFWSRKEVLFDGIKIAKSSSNEAVLFVAAPMSNQSFAPISFKLLNASFLNNNAGILLENVGSSGIKYEVDNVVFEENKIIGSDSSLGVFHLDIAKPFYEKNLSIGNLAFYNNLAGKTQIGISLSGNAESINANAIFTANNQRPVYDYFADPRLPQLKSTLKNIYDWQGEQCFIQGLKHQTNLVLAQAKNSCVISALLDTNGINLPFTQIFKNDSLQISYSNGLASKLITANGIVIDIPAIEKLASDSIIDAKKNAAPIVVKLDTLINPGVPFEPSYEIGAWGGLACYVGDLRHKFGVPGIFEWTGGLYLQYNKRKNWSYRASFYRTNIGMHDPTAPLFIWQGAPLFVSNNNTIMQRQSWDANFKTKMYILDFDFIYYFAPKHDYSLVNKDKKGHFIPAIGMGIGFMRFDPYRCVVYHKNKDTAEYIPLRPLGMEGQNFLKTNGKYGAYTVNVNVSLQLAYVYRKFRLRYELKTVLSMSDYLDDYGQGYTYGGDYDKWKASLGNIDLPIDKSTGKQITIEQAFPQYNTTIKRTHNLLPDMFFQHHIGISYDISGLFKKKGK